MQSTSTRARLGKRSGRQLRRSLSITSFSPVIAWHGMRRVEKHGAASRWQRCRDVLCRDARRRTRRRRRTEWWWRNTRSVAEWHPNLLRSTEQPEDDDDEAQAQHTGAGAAAAGVDRLDTHELVAQRRSDRERQGVQRCRCRSVSARGRSIAEPTATRQAHPRSTTATANA